MAQRIALYGGTFNPIHHGHLIVARAVLEHFGLNRVVFLPSATPPHKHAEDLCDAVHRESMVKLGIEGEPGFEFSDFDLRRDGPSYTIETINHFRRELGPETELFWVIGADSLSELSAWMRIQDLVEACHVVTAVRPGWREPPWDDLRHALTEDHIKALQGGILHTPLIGISATDIRERVGAGKSVRFLIPENVRAHIERHQLYS